MNNFVIGVVVFVSVFININMITDEDFHVKESIMNPLGQVEEVELKVNTYYDVPLSYELQDYVREVCSEYDVDMEVILGIMNTESHFRHEASSNNNIGGKRSLGICQLNENYIDWFGELTGLEDLFDINNIYHNIEGGIATYKFYRDYWERKGYEGEELRIRSLNTYNAGIVGYKKYINKYNTISRNYDKKVLDYKNNLSKV